MRKAEKHEIRRYLAEISRYFYLLTNPRTLENWEQGRAKPNAQAVLLICLVAHYPETLARLEQI